MKELKDLWSSVRAGKLLITLCFVGAAAAAYTISRLMEPSYVATATALLSLRENSLSEQLPATAYAGYISTQLEIINSPRVAAKARERLNGAHGAAGAALVPEVDATQLTVKPVKDSQVIQISYAAPVAQQAAKVANAYLDAYIAVVTDINKESAAERARWLQDELRTLRAQVSEAQTNLVDYQRKGGIVTADERVDAESTRLNELVKQLVTAESEAYRVRSRAEEARRLLAGKGSLDGLPEVVASPSVQRLTAELARQRGELKSLAAKLGEEHPAYSKAMILVQEASVALEREKRGVAQGIVQTAQAAQNREAELRNAVNAQREKLLAVKAKTEQLPTLQDEVQVAQTGYGEGLARYNSELMKSRLDLANVAVLGRAQVPTEPASPNMKLNVAVGGLFGLLLGIGAAHMRRIGRNLMTRDEDLDDLGVPTFAVIERR